MHTRVKQFRIEDDYRPVAWIGGQPVHVTLILVAAHVAVMLAGVILGAGSLDALRFDSGRFWAGEAPWSPITYPFVGSPTLGFAFGMFLLFWFGREVERYVGRIRFLLLYGGLVLAPSLLLVALGRALPSALSGSWLPHLGVFFTFALLYPRVDLLYGLGLQARWVALALGLIALLQAIAIRSLPDLLALLCTAGVCLWTLRHAGFRVLPEFPTARSPSPRRRSLPNPRPRVRSRRAPAVADPEATMDRLLEKIAREGMAGLTPAERAELERAREALLRREEKV